MTDKIYPDWISDRLPTEEDIKEEGQIIVKRLLSSSDVLSKQKLLEMSTDLWEGSLQWVKETQNKSFDFRGRKNEKTL